MPSRNIWLLALSQVFGNSGSSMLVFVGGLIGASLAPTERLSTLPISLMIIGTALAVVPTAMLLCRIGRKRGYLLGAAIGILAALLAAFALLRANYALFCMAALLIGANNAFVLQYRFGAIESVPPERSGQAVSSVLIGGMLAGYLGPEIARRTSAALPAAFSASFLILAGMYVMVVLLLFFMEEGKPFGDVIAEPERPLKQILTQPTFIAAVMAGTIAYGIMSLIMTATPIQMHTFHGLSLADTALVIQSHIIAMYLPSLFNAFLFDRLGVQRVMLAGVVCLLACVGIGLYSRELFHYWSALVLLGIGWNFLFVGATVLLTQSYRPAERFRVQAINDFTIFGIQALASLSAGTIIFSANWSLLLWLTVPVLLLILVVIVALPKPALQPAVE